MPVIWGHAAAVSSIVLSCKRVDRPIRWRLGTEIHLGFFAYSIPLEPKSFKGPSIHIVPELLSRCPEIRQFKRHIDPYRSDPGMCRYGRCSGADILSCLPPSPRAGCPAKEMFRMTVTTGRLCRMLLLAPRSLPSLVMNMSMIKCQWFPSIKSIFSLDCILEDGRISCGRLSAQGKFSVPMTP